MFSGMTYDPDNYKDGYGGLVRLRTALQKSLNSAHVQVVEKIGYDRVSDFAHRVGLTKKFETIHRVSTNR